MSERTRITSVQIRAARAMLNWSAWQLSERSGISQSSIHRAERAQGRPSMHEHSLAAIKAALERYGVEFLDDCGVRLVSAPGIAEAGVIDPPSMKAGVDARSKSHHPWGVHLSTG
jgi:transcriptional regulator with XRE-family HTH domain